MRLECPYTTRGRWFKGNIHTHTTVSDGKSEPAVVARWYRDHDYHFLALTDHDTWENPQGQITPDPMVDDILILVPSNEITSPLGDIVALNVPKLTDHIACPTIQSRIDDVGAMGGLAVLAHPDYRQGHPISFCQSLTGLTGIEIFNRPGGTINSTEKWDALLTAGQRVWGFASDDMHLLERDAGRAWLVVRAPKLTAEAIITAITAGDFYASTGPDLELWTEGHRICCKTEQGWRIRWVGAHGVVMREVIAREDAYTPRGDELYVRAQVVDAEGRWAWAQPVFVMNEADPNKERGGTFQ